MCVRVSKYTMSISVCLQRPFKRQKLPPTDLFSPDTFHVIVAQLLPKLIQNNEGGVESGARTLFDKTNSYIDKHKANSYMNKMRRAGQHIANLTATCVAGREAFGSTETEVSKVTLDILFPFISIVLLSCADADFKGWIKGLKYALSIKSGRMNALPRLLAPLISETLILRGSSSRKQVNHPLHTITTVRQHMPRNEKMQLSDVYDALRHDCDLSEHLWHAAKNARVPIPLLPLGPVVVVTTSETLLDACLHDATRRCLQLRWRQTLQQPDEPWLCMEATSTKLRRAAFLRPGESSARPDTLLIAFGVINFAFDRGEGGVLWHCLSTLHDLCLFENKDTTRRVCLELLRRFAPMEVDNVLQDVIAHKRCKGDASSIWAVHRFIHDYSWFDTVTKHLETLQNAIGSKTCMFALQNWVRDEGGHGKEDHTATAFLYDNVFRGHSSKRLQRVLEAEEPFLLDLTYCLRHSDIDNVSQIIKLARLLRRVHLGASLATGAELFGVVGVRGPLDSEQCAQLNRCPLKDAPQPFADMLVRKAAEHGDAASVMLYAPPKTSLECLRVAWQADVRGIRSVRCIDDHTKSSVYVALPWWASAEDMKRVFMAESSTVLHHDTVEAIRLILTEPITSKDAMQELRKVSAFESRDDAPQIMRDFIACFGQCAFARLPSLCFSDEACFDVLKELREKAPCLMNGCRPWLKKSGKKERSLIGLANIAMIEKWVADVTVTNTTTLRRFLTTLGPVARHACLGTGGGWNCPLGDLVWPLS